MSETVITAETYALWLQAGHPPFEWFAGLDHDQQQTFATQGAIHRIESALDAARAIHDPVGFEAECFPGSAPEAEKVVAERLAEQAVAAVTGILGGGAPQSVPVEPAAIKAPSMVGALERCEADAQARTDATGSTRMLMGRRSDAYREAE